MRHLTVAFVLLLAALALAQERPTASMERRFPVEGQYKPSPQPDPTRLIALVPVVPVPGTTNAKAPLFLEELDSPQRDLRAETNRDSSKAEVPSGIVAFRAMYSDDDEWALLDLRARDAGGLRAVRESRDPRVRIFTVAELETPEARKAISLPAGLSLVVFLDQ